jgi:hypothetical protein
MRIVRLDHVQLAMPAGGEGLARAFYIYVDDPFGNRLELLEPFLRR